MARMNERIGRNIIVLLELEVRVLLQEKAQDALHVVTSAGLNGSWHLLLSLKH